MTNKFLLNTVAAGMLFCSAADLSAQKGNAFVVEGNLQGIKENTWVYLSHKWNDEIVTDSVKAGKYSAFKFKGTTQEPNMYWIYDSPKSQQFLIFFVDKGTVEIKGELAKLSDATVKAGSSQEDYTVYRNILKTFDERKTAMTMEFQQAQQSGDQGKMQDIQVAYGNLMGEQSDKIDAFITSHPKSVVAAYAIWASTQEEPDLFKMENNFKVLDASVKKSKFGKIVEERINAVKGSTIGYPILEFSQNDANGKPISISSFKGKVVLVDFWASWCGPCRMENPNVVKAYNAFKDKGFDILGVSFDSSKDKWLAAVEKDHLAWTHVSDLKGWGNEVGQKFGIRSIPQNFLIDKDGKIIAKNLRGEELYAKLQEVLK